MDEVPENQPTESPSPVPNELNSLRDKLTDPDAVDGVCQAMADLWLSGVEHDDEIRKLSMFSDMVEILVSEHACISKVVITALRSIATMCDSTAEAAAQFYFVGACDSIVQAMKLNILDDAVILWGSRSILSMATNSPSARATLGTLNACKVIAVGIKNNITNPDCCEWGWKALYSLALNDYANTTKLSACNVHRQILETLVLHELNPEIIECCCHIILLLTELKEEDRVIFQEAKGCEKVSRILWGNVHDTHLVSLLCLTIAAITICNIKNISLIKDYTSTATSTACEAIMHVLRLHYLDENIVESGCRALCSLSLNNEECQMKLGEIGASTVLSAILLHHQNNDIIIALILHELVILLQLKDNIPILATEDTCKLVIILIKIHTINVSVLCQACALIFLLGSQISCKSNLISLNAIDIINHILISHGNNGDIAFEGCRAFNILFDTNIIIKDDSNYNQYCNAMTSTIQMHISDPIIIAEACKALYTIANGNLNNKFHINTNEAISAVLSVLNTHSNDSTVCLYGTRLMSTLALLDYFDIGSITSRTFGHEDICMTLVQTLKLNIENRSVTEAALEAINNIALSDDMRAYLGTAGVCEWVIKALHTHRVSPSVAEVGCLTVYILSSHSTNKVEFNALETRSVIYSILKELSLTDRAREKAKNALQRLKYWGIW